MDTTTSGRPESGDDRVPNAARASVWRPCYHITPPHGFLNDPNGLAHFDGVYHVCYQWLPEVTLRGAKQWRHAVSTDLVHWQDAECALNPTEWYETHGCYSGSGIVADKLLYYFYTGNVRDAEGGRETYQCVAVSRDGRAFDKLGPAVYLPEEAYTAHFRDPKVWRAHNAWWMIVGAQTIGRKGNVALFTSDDLKSWHWLGSMLDEDHDWGYMCECPDVISIDGHDYLVASVQKTEGCRAMVFPGTLDYDRAHFGLSGSPAKYFDEGFDFYAPQSFIDGSGRHLLFAWIGGGDEEYQLSQPSVADGWLHSLTVPRVLTVHDGELCQEPAAELQTLRSSGVVQIATDTWADEPGEDAPAARELLIEMPDPCDLSLFIEDGLRVTYAAESGMLRFERKRWNADFYDMRECVVGPLHDVHVFVDRSVVELFANKGRLTWTSKVYLGAQAHISVCATRKVTVSVWKMEGLTNG